MTKFDAIKENRGLGGSAKSFFNNDATHFFFKPKARVAATVNSKTIQPKLKIGEAGDNYEVEADMMAEKVTSFLANKTSQNRVQRTCDSCKEDEGVEAIQRLTQQIQKKSFRGNQSRKSSAKRSIINDGVQNKLVNAKSNGKTLPAGVKNDMETAFGTEFNNVRIHTDAEAIQMNQQLGAKAFAYGNDIYFNRGNFQPYSRRGKHLLAHELTHTLQQSGLIQRSFGDASAECSSVIASSSCASGDDCALPDPVSNTSQLGRYLLKVNIDIERETFEEALDDTALGHAYIEMISDTGSVYTYGFYPEAAVPNENVRNVPGCIHHPDTSHENCLDDTVTFELTSEQFEFALNRAQEICRNRHSYGQNYTCTSFANQVVTAAGQSLPSSASRPIIINHTLGIEVPPIDNPNSLLESLRRLGPPPRNIYNVERYSSERAASEVVNRYLYVVRLLMQNPEITEEVLFIVQEFRAIAFINGDFSTMESRQQFEEALLNDGRINQDQLQQLMSLIQISLE